MILSDLIKLAPGERVIMKLRRHPIIFLGQFSLVIFLLAVPFLIGYMIVTFHPSWLESAAIRPALILLAGAYFLNVLLFGLATFVDYYLDSWIVTSSRLIDIQQDGLFSRTVAELELARVQDAASDIRGILPSLLNYGNVHVQTAGEKERFAFEQVSRPERIRRELMQLVEKNTF